MMKSRWRHAGILALGLAVISGLSLWLAQRAPPPPPVPAPSVGALASGEPRLTDAAGRQRSLEQQLPAAAAAITSARDPAARKSHLAALREALSQAGAARASVAVQQFLDSKTDAVTSLSFKLDRQGDLDEAPTLRTFLLDYLGQIDPAAAAAYARLILRAKDSPEEWALALRNLARGDPSPAARELLLEKTQDLLRYTPWQQDPGIGYLEAFDTAVFLGGTNLVPALADLVRRKDNPAVAHAAFLALDRLVINEPAVLLAALQDQPDLLQGREPTRANYFARADVRDPAQRGVLEQYLLDPRTSSTELQRFAGLYPSANYLVSPNLLTASSPPAPSGLAERDAESLRLVQEWLEDPRFQPLRPQLEQVKRRLEAFARQSNPGQP